MGKCVDDTRHEKEKRMIKKTLVLFALASIFSTFVLANDSDKEKNKFRFAFFTDIHLNKGDNNCFEGLGAAI